MSQVILSVGTQRGLFVFESDEQRRDWALRGPYLKGWAVYHALVDTRGAPKVHAAGCHFGFGTNTFRSNLGKIKFAGAEQPPVPPKLPAKAAKFAKKHGLPVAPQVLHIEPGPADAKKVLFAGTAPAGLFRSEDTGKTWQEVQSLTRHKTRKDWNPGAGGMCLHSIQVDPADSNRMYLAISAAGAFRTDDGGDSWTPINDQVAPYRGAPPEESQVFSCVHKLLVHPTQPGRLYQQNHVGVYRSDDFGSSWQRIDKGLPSDFGFPLALDPADPERCFVVPLESGDYSFRATGGALQVYRREGTSWKALGEGLPAEGAFVGVKREGLASDPLSPCGVYLGTSTGQLYASADRGDSWRAVATHLPPILSVSAAVV